ncbi:MAG: IS1595 family transposase [Brevundimonas sp.]|uniref:IS1595 family transposase n=1 Tax=Brevundimonas sp. TaxID=1871086 RepID=UPI000DB3CF55|nr:IS1595 family transposase [Brevundimonas sp.]PZU76293.1 MAG: IS1595 family transposase [Brevundimonas sp.]
MSVLSKPYFHDEEAAFRFVEGLIWSNEPVCPKCGGVDRISAIKANPEKRVRYGLKKCGQCKSQFTVRMGTIFEESKLPLHKWLQAIYLMCSSKKGISAKQLERTLEVTYKTAWFLAHRIREAMRSGELAPFGQDGGAVEVDETYIGREPGKPVKRAFHHKMKVLSLVDRSTGQVRSVVVDNIRPATIAPIVLDNLHREARLMTDEAGHYLAVGHQFAEHGVVRHGQDEYVSTDDRTIHTNTIEGYFSIFKRGMKGVYQHCSKKHLHRYLAEFDFRYSNRSALGCEDQERAMRAVVSGVGKRLTYRGPDGRTEAAA